MWHKTLLWQYWQNYRCFWRIHSELNISPVIEMCEKCQVVLVSCTFDAHVPCFTLNVVSSDGTWSPICHHVRTHSLPRPACQWHVRDCQYTLYHLKEFFFPSECDICHRWCHLSVSARSLTTTRPTVPAQVIGCIVQVTFSANRREVLSVYIWQTRSCWSHYWKVTYNIHLQVFSFHHGLQWSSLARLNTQRTLLIYRKHNI